MQEAIERLVRDVTLVTLALAIALGWSLFHVAQGFAVAITSLLTHPSSSDLLDLQSSEPLTWAVGGRILNLFSLVTGLIELAVVLAVALLVLRRARRAH
jgi:phosphotransferase system  glucose/maltose/N-acetylglucosamine-specific IIC component